MDIRKRGRRPGSKNYTQEFRQLVVAQTHTSGRSISEVAQSHGLNANMVSQWRRRAAPDGGSNTPGLVPVNIVGMPSGGTPAATDSATGAPSEPEHRGVALTGSHVDVDIEVGNRRMVMRGVPQALVEQLLREWFQ